MKLLSNYNLRVNPAELNNKLDSLIQQIGKPGMEVPASGIFSLLDLTSLGVSDNEESIGILVEKLNCFPEKYKNMPEVAAFCTYPVFTPFIAEKLTSKSIRKAVVAASFPSSQTFHDLKINEIKRVIEEGADEVDIVISVGKFLSGDYEGIYNEIHEFSEVTGDKILKVILETAVLENPDQIKTASLLCLEAGADFIKTSTGKNGKGASFEAVMVMCEAISEFYQMNGKTAGIKPAGGISDYKTAAVYYGIVKEMLGSDWLQPSRFRIGASRLANDLLEESYF